MVEASTSILTGAGDLDLTLASPSCLALSTAGWSAALLPELLLLLEELDESLLLDLLPLLAELLLLLELLERDELLEELSEGVLLARLDLLSLSLSLCLSRSRSLSLSRSLSRSLSLPLPSLRTGLLEGRLLLRSRLLDLPPLNEQHVQ